MKHLSVFDKDRDVLIALSEIHLNGKWYDLDCTYSKGVFYKELDRPRMASDLFPTQDFVMEDDSTVLKMQTDNSLNSIVFDPPFLFRDRKSDNNDKMCKRFSYFKTFGHLMKMYRDSLSQFHRVLKKGGFIFFKCQDMTDGKFYCTHRHIIEVAEELGFTLEDIGIKVTNSKLQRDAVQQNCLAKVHSYWIVFKK